MIFILLSFYALVGIVALLLAAVRWFWRLAVPVEKPEVQRIWKTGDDARRFPPP